MSDLTALALWISGVTVLGLLLEKGPRWLDRRLTTYGDQDVVSRGLQVAAHRDAERFL